MPSGMRAFILIAIGQFISYLGTGMTRFATTVWAYEMTGKATTLALVGFFSFAPLIIMTPFAGALVDRWNRKLVMMLADLGAGIATIALLILYLTGRLEVWHLMVAGAWAGAFEAFQWPAFSATISVMVKKEDYARANGLLGLAESASSIFAPVMAGALLPFITLAGILVIDIITFSLAVLAVLVVFIPQPPHKLETAGGRASILGDAVFGFRYIFARASLLGLQMLFFFMNFSGSAAATVTPAMILARTSNNESTMGIVQSALGVGGVVGGVIMSTWGGPRRRIHSVLLGFIGGGLLGLCTLAVGQSLPVWVVGAFITMFFTPFLNGGNQAIWQAKVAPDIQGRVFAARRLIAQVSAPVGMILGGLLADRIFGPMMMDPASRGAQIFSPVFGTGPGAGIAVLIFLIGIFEGVVGMSGYMIGVIRDAETILPDHTLTHGELEQAQGT